jgi:transposase
MGMSIIGIETARSVFRLHGVDANGKVQLKHRLRRSEAIAFSEQPPRCTAVLQACGAAHHSAHVLVAPAPR